MPVEIPLNPAGERFVSVNVGPETFIFRSYYTYGADSHWLLDIRNSQNQPLISGINLVRGANNLLKGRGDILNGYQLFLVVYQGSEKDLNAPGNSMALIWFNHNEENPFLDQDPMDTIGSMGGVMGSFDMDRLNQRFLQ